MNLENKIESILFFKNEPVAFSWLAKIVEASEEEVREATKNLAEFYKDRGMVLIMTDTEVAFGTHPDNFALIEKLQKEELSRELGRAGLETLAIILYKGPISRREVDHIRGVNSGFIIRNLLIRGLIERTDPSSAPGQEAAGRSYSYKATLKLLQHLGIGSIEELPEYGTAFTKLDEFINSQSAETENDA